MLFHRALTYLIAALSVGNAASQWEIQDAHTTASLRGIHYVGNGVAWASGTDGTVLRTEDMGFVWQLCTIPPGAEKLDFRGIQAFDNNTAIVMSSGKGDLSRLYKTTDGCQTWKLLFTNPDKDGFWDSLRAYRYGHELALLLLGDPVDGRFATFTSTYGGGTKLEKFDAGGLKAMPGESAFAASNSSEEISFDRVALDCLTGIFGTGGSSVSRIMRNESCLPYQDGWRAHILEGFATGRTAGIFSIKNSGLVWVAVGGDYNHPALSEGTAAYSRDDGKEWTISREFPHGYRSSVDVDKKAKTWITVGPNGTDISTDDGRNWHPLKPAPGDAPDADQHWNALSLPFVVGPKGRIGLLHSDLLAQSKVH